MARGRTPNLPDITILRDASKDEVSIPTGMTNRTRRAIYRALVRDMMARSIWIETFAPAVEVLSGALFDYRRAREKLDEEGSVVLVEGVYEVSPWHKVAKDSAATMSRLGKDFGWTIASLYALLRAATGNEYRRQMIMDTDKTRSEKAALLPFEDA